MRFAFAEWEFILYEIILLNNLNVEYSNISDRFYFVIVHLNTDI